MEFTLLWAAATGVGLALLMTRVEKRLALVPKEVGNLGDLILGAAVTGLLTGRLAAMALAGTSPFTNPGDILIIRSGVDTGFASLGALLFVGLTSRPILPEVIDLLAPAALVGLGGWHAGCLYRGTCLGTPSTLPWAFSQSGSPVTRHPVEIYAALLFLVFGLLLLWWLRSGRHIPGTVGATGLALAGLSRLVTEPMRPSLGTGPIGWYGSAIFIGSMAALALWWVAGRRSV